ncbi:hypothetical protein L6452_33427 [Arctium lappa]|uniref:Uncharacterized protein n=1 Tax=Arctium lappa TaxID=4217 RepID=A0ACB8YGH2_ARCLA|nr:hypothetical protein L6452_33427 [Arctium lappa]
MGKMVRGQELKLVFLHARLINQNHNTNSFIFTISFNCLPSSSASVLPDFAPSKPLSRSRSKTFHRA